MIKEKYQVKLIENKDAYYFLLNIHYARRIPHIFASAHPKMSPSLIVKYIKGITTRKLFIEFPELKNRLRKGHLWNPSYYIETIGSISEDAIKKYIENQRKGL